MANRKRVDIIITPNPPDINPIHLAPGQRFTGIGGTVRVATMRAAEQLAIHWKPGRGDQSVTVQVRKSNA